MNIEKLNRLVELSKTIEDISEGKFYKLHPEFLPLCVELVPELFDGCHNEAEWEISREDDTGHLSYSCTDHLSDMVEIETTDIKKVVVGEWGKCNMIGTIYNERFYKDVSKG